MRLPLHDNLLEKDTEGLAVLKGELDLQLQNNRFNKVVLVGASGSGKTAACFQYAAQERYVRQQSGSGNLHWYTQIKH
eukprot:161893-Rhodomonas_salina.2